MQCIVCDVNRVSAVARAAALRYRACLRTKADSGLKPDSRSHDFHSELKHKSVCFNSHPQRHLLFYR